MYNILVVYDDKEIVNAIDIYLSKEGYNVILKFALIFNWIDIRINV